jgi:hypothetical protein
MRADLVGLGARLGWVAAEDKEEPALATVMERLRREGDGILLIYDNAIEARGLAQWLPRSGAARVIVTSNAHAWRGVAEPVEIRGRGASAPTLYRSDDLALLPIGQQRHRAAWPIGHSGDADRALG